MRHRLNDRAVFREILHSEVVQDEYQVDIAVLGGFAAAIASLNPYKMDPLTEAIHNFPHNLFNPEVVVNHMLLLCCDIFLL